MATNFVLLSSDGVEKQTSVSKKQKYGQNTRVVHKKKDDPRRIAAKKFLLGISINSSEGASQIPPTNLEAVERLEGDATVANQNQWNRSNLVELSTTPGNQSLPATPGNDSVILSASEYRLQPTRHPVARSHSNIESPSQRRKILAHSKWNTYAEGTHVDPRIEFMSNNIPKARLVYVFNGTPAAVSSIVHYIKPIGTITRGSISALKEDQLNLEEILPQDREVSLNHLLDPMWSLMRDDAQQIVVEGTEPGPSDGIAAYTSFPCAFFSTSHSPLQVIHHYHPKAIDNSEYFVGKNNTVVALPGYKVTIMEYARSIDIKKGINEQFKEIYPHINITLSKIRSIKREMTKISIAVGLDLAIVAYAYVYFEKLILMGKVDKPKRKILAGACLLLSAKMYFDLRHGQAKELIEEIANVFRVSSKDVIEFEFPVLVTLQFSLLVPNGQVKTHWKKLTTK